MKYNTLLIAFFVLIITSKANSQNQIDLILKEIANNNKSIIANQQYWEAKKLSFKTGLNPVNPKIEYEYLQGSSTKSGNQSDLFVLQEFDFPTAYIRKNQVAKQQVAQAKFQVESYRKTILLNAKKHCIKLVYLNKKRVELSKRLNNITTLKEHYQTKLSVGDANTLDLNKIKIQFIELNNELRLNKSEIDLIKQKITELNGGKSIEFIVLEYPNIKTILSFETIEKAIEKNDPDLKLIHQQNEIDRKKLQLSKAMSLPKLEAGFRSQELLGQKLQGIHLGITVPLWENKNTIKHQKAHLLFNDFEIEEHHNEHHSEIKQQYNQYKSLAISIKEYNEILPQLNNIKSLKKALDLGEISTIEYFTELNYFYKSYDNFLKLEKSYHQIIAELHKYEL